MTGPYSRRQALVTGGLATIGALTGCLHGSDGGSRDVPAYADLIPPFDGQSNIIYLDADTLDELLDDYLPEEVAERSVTGQAEGGTDYGDPVLDILLSGGLIFPLFAGFSFRGTGLRGILGLDEETPDFETDLDEFLLIYEAMLLRGDVDTDEVESTLQSAPADEPLQEEYEQVEESGGFAIFRPVDRAEDQVFALNDEMILGGQTRDAIDPVLARLAGDEPKATDEIDAFEWALSEAGDAPFVFGGHGEAESGDEDPEYQELVGATTLVGSLELDGDDVPTEMAVFFDDGSDLDRDAIKGGFGTRAAEGSIDFEDDRFTLSATYEASVLQNPQGE